MGQVYGLNKQFQFLLLDNRVKVNVILIFGGIDDYKSIVIFLPP